MTRRRAIPAVAALMLLVAAGVAAAADKPLAVDARAPEFAAVDQYGKPFTLSEALARRDWVVIAFYPKAFSGT